MCSLFGATRIEVDGFGFLPGNPPQIIRRYTMVNKNKAFVRLITLGAGVQSVKIPNKNGDITDVIVGFDNVKGYLENRYIGRIVGRTSRPFCRKKSKDSDYEHCFDMVNWDSYILDDHVVMTHVSRNSERHPGDLMCQVKYTWSDDNKLHIEISGTCTKPTPINISSQCLFNLAGHAMGPRELKKHMVTVNAENWAESDVADGTFTGVIQDVQNSVYDLRWPVQLNKKTLFNVPGGGYSQNLCVSSPSTWCYRFHARVLHPGSKRYLQVYSNHPTVQFYTGNDFPHKDEESLCLVGSGDYDDSEDNTITKPEEKVIGKDGLPYTRHGFFALIPQGFPTAKNRRSFPSNILYPGKVYTHNITYEFGIRERTSATFSNKTLVYENAQLFYLYKKIHQCSPIRMSRRATAWRRLVQSVRTRVTPG